MYKFHPFLAFALACVACGSRFTATDDGDGSGDAGRAGAASGGSSSGDAGRMEVGGTSAAGQGSTAGAGGSIGGSSSAGNSGWGSAGWRSGSGGTGSGAECAMLRQEYQAAVEKARACDKGSTDQCSPSSVAEPVGCGCPVLVNAKSEDTAAAKEAYQRLRDSKCDYGANCDIACAPIMSANCSRPLMGNTFVCTAGIGIAN